MKLVTLTLGVVGVAVIFGSEALTSGRAAIPGAAAVFGASICVAFSYVWMKRYGSQIPPLALTTIQSGTAVVPLLCVALIKEGIPAPAHWSFAAWTAVAYLAIAASVVAFWLNYRLLARMDAFLGGICVLVAVVSRLVQGPGLKGLDLCEP